MRTPAPLDPRPFGIGLVGWGNIGTGLLKHLHDESTVLRSRTAGGFAVRWVCDKDLSRPRSFNPPSETKFTSDYRDVIADPEVDAVVELIGGVEAAGQVVRAALTAGKHVVTANKALLAHQGAQIFALARDHGVHVGYEASVGAGIPLIRSIRRGLDSCRVTAIRAVINGTTNFILTSMEDDPKTTFDSALAEAQRLGFAEPDPSLDIDGHDPAQKLVVLAMTAFGVAMSPTVVSVRGVREVGPEEATFARENRLRLRLVATAERTGAESFALHVRPTFVDRANLLGCISGVNNGVVIDAEPIGPTFYYGAGAGQRSTSTGLLSDLMELAELKAFGNRKPHRVPLPIMIHTRSEQAEEKVPHYFRVRLTKGQTLPEDALPGRPLRTGDGHACVLLPPMSLYDTESMLARLKSSGISLSDCCRVDFSPELSDRFGFAR